MKIHGMELPKLYYKKSIFDPINHESDGYCNSCLFGRVDSDNNYHCSIVQGFCCAAGVPADKCTGGCDSNGSCDTEFLKRVLEQDEFVCPIFSEVSNGE